MQGLGKSPSKKSPVQVKSNIFANLKNLLVSLDEYHKSMQGSEAREQAQQDRVTIEWSPSQVCIKTKCKLLC